MGNLKNDSSCLGTKKIVNAVVRIDRQRIQSNHVLKRKKKKHIEAQ